MAANSRGPRAECRSDYVRPKLDPKDVPTDMTAAQTVDWVSGDQARAEAALAAEKKRKDPRTTVVDSLDKLAKDETGAGIANGEA